MFLSSLISMVINYVRLQKLAADIAPASFTGIVDFSSWTVQPGANRLELSAIDATDRVLSLSFTV
jgi:hypothetical protein